MGFLIFFLKSRIFCIPSSFFYKRALSCKKIKFLFFLLCFCIFQSEAVKIQFPDEELASESVLPLIDPPQMVLNRSIPLKYRVELGAGIGFGLDEPFYFPFYGTGMLAFNLTEVHAASVTGTYFFPLRSSSGEKLSQGEGLKPGQTFDPLKAPYPQMMAFINYQYTPYYGKISLAKNWVMNLSIYGFVGPGLLVFNQNNRTFVGNLGIGQKLYINKWMGIRADLGIYGYYGPSIAKLNLGDDVGDVSYSQITAEQKRLLANILFNIGVIFLLL